MSRLKSLFLGCLLVLPFLMAGRLCAEAPTAEQLKMFQQLPPEQQRQLLDAFTKSQGQTSSSQPEIVTQPEVAQPREVVAPGVGSGDAAAGAQPVAVASPESPKAALSPLKPFGYDLFAGTPSTFAPATDIPIPSDYVLGPGDDVIIQLYGKENLTYELTVSREGVLQFPGIGPVPVAGLSFRDLKYSLNETVSRQIIGCKASITLGNLRSIRIFVLGEAHRPGSYTVSALSTMTNALF
ncbi:MAG: polysaccharide biosynthesis/export family protein [Desulfobacterales bacterium]|nr:MAG: polysaccharide biosynthesis/export family protein [Desulfobacterales bacterium]